MAALDVVGTNRLILAGAGVGAALADGRSLAGVVKDDAVVLAVHGTGYVGVLLGIAGDPSLAGLVSGGKILEAVAGAGLLGVDLR